MPKISELNELTVLSANDYFAVAHDINGLPSTNKIQAYHVANTLNSYFPHATSNTSGTVLVGNNISINSTGYIYVPFASNTSPGVVLVGNNLTINSSGYLSSTGGGSGGLPVTNISNGYVLQVTGGGTAYWTAFTGVFNTTTVNAATTYDAGLETIVFVNPAQVGQNVIVNLPIASGVQGKEYTVKNINPGPQGYSVIVTTDNISSSYLEDPVTGSLVTSVTMSSIGQGETWIFDGYIYRHIVTQRVAPIFYTSANTYHQVVVTNKSSANNASGDLVVYGDTGDYVQGTGPFIDIGVDSSTYANNQYTLFSNSSAYIYTANTNLLVGAGSPQTNVVIFTNNDPNLINQETAHTWTFDYNGILTLPGNILIGANVEADPVGADFYASDAHSYISMTYGPDPTAGSASYLSWAPAGGVSTAHNLNIQAWKGDVPSNFAQWTFSGGDGSFTLPAGGTIRYANTVPFNQAIPTMPGPYSSQSAAASAGVPLKGLYYDSTGVVHIRLT